MLKNVWSYLKTLTFTCTYAHLDFSAFGFAPFYFIRHPTQSLFQLMWQPKDAFLLRHQVPYFPSLLLHAHFRSEFSELQEPDILSFVARFHEASNIVEQLHDLFYRAALLRVSLRGLEVMFTVSNPRVRLRKIQMVYTNKCGIISVPRVSWNHTYHAHQGSK